MKTCKALFIILPVIFTCLILIAPMGATASEFAQWNAPPEDVAAQVPDYEIKPNLSNVANFCDNVLYFYVDWNSEKNEEVKYPNDLLKKEEIKMLAENGFCVSPSYYREFFPLYEENRYNVIANFVTTDSILHNYHLMFDHLLMQLESEQLALKLEKINTVMLAISLEQFEKFKGTEWESPARRNVAFFTVGSKLLKPDIQIPSIVKSEVTAELKLINSAGGIEASPVMNIKAIGERGSFSPLDVLKEDYTQYIPRGHYTKSEFLKRYFKSMMWYGRMTFTSEKEDMIRSAILITYALDDERIGADYETIYDTVSFFVGQSDDLTSFQFNTLLKEIYGEKASWKTVNENSYWFYDFIGKVKDLPSPQINSMPIFNADIQPDREKEIRGFRFMGQKFTLDASIFQKLIDRDVPDRMLPKGLDIPAAMGSDEALKILESMGDTKYANYTSNMDKIRGFISGLNADTWTQNLYWGWLYTLVPLTEVKEPGYPQIMQSDLWARKDLNTYLGSWTELKHDTILYAKQVYAECGDGDSEYPERDDRGYVEPNVKLYSRLSGLIDLTVKGLEGRNLLSDNNRQSLKNMNQLVNALYTISVKELGNISLTTEEYELIRSYGAQLEHMWLEINKDDFEKLGYGGPQDYLDENPAALVADVATDPNGSVLEEATGHIFTIYAIVPVAGELKLVSGGVYSYYEFPWPMSDRLTDQKWRELLNQTDCPSLPEWTSVFRPPAENSQ